MGDQSLWRQYSLRQGLMSTGHERSTPHWHVFSEAKLGGGSQCSWPSIYSRLVSDTRRIIVQEMLFRVEVNTVWQMDSPSAGQCLSDVAGRVSAQASCVT